MTIEREQRGDTTWLVLPPRDRSRAAAWVMAGFGLFVTALMAVWIGNALAWNLPAGTPVAIRIAQLLLAAVGLAGLALGLGLLVAGLGQIRGWPSRCAIGIDARAVLVRELIGPLHWTRAMPLGGLRAILVDTAACAPGPTSRFRERLLLRRAGHTDLVAAHGYPAELLRELAATLHAGLGREAQARLVTADPAVLGPPPGTLEVEEADGRIAILLQPPCREWSVAVFAGMWLVFLGFFTWAALFGRLIGSLYVVVPLLLLPFWAAGIGLALWFVHCGWGRIDLLWADRQLSMIQRSPLRRRIRSWSHDDLSAILLAEQGSGSGRYRAVTLQTRRSTDDELPRHPDEAANAWIAARLRLALAGVDPATAEALPIIAAASAPAPLAALSARELPAGSRVVIRDGSDGLLVEMPPTGFGYGFAAMFACGLVFAAGGSAVCIWAALSRQIVIAPAGVICILFGGALAWFGLHYATRSVRITAGPQDFTVLTSDRLSRRSWSRPLADITTIQVEDSGMVANNRTVWRAVVADRAGQRCTWGETTDPSELAVITARLRAMLDRRAQ